MNELPYWLAIASWIGGFAVASARAARRVNRRSPIWFAIGAIAGPIALLILRLAPPGQCRTCGTPTRGWARICWWCHEDVRSAPASTKAILDRMSSRITPPKEPPPPVTRQEPVGPFVLPANAVEPTEALRVMATAVFVAGGARLEPGQRYGLALRSGRFLVLGPTDIDPSAVVVDRDIADIDVRIVEGRLIVSEPRGRSGIVLAFMFVAGASAADLVSTIMEAARAGGRI